MMVDARMVVGWCGGRWRMGIRGWEGTSVKTTVQSDPSLATAPVLKVYDVRTYSRK